jgi:hypothetical protein
VGIEPNPGPPKANSLLKSTQSSLNKELFADIGRLLADIVSKKGSTPKKAKAKRKKIQNGNAAMSATSTVFRNNPNVSNAPVIRNTYKQSVMSLPFSASNMYVCADASGNLVFGSTLSTVKSLPIDPLYSLSPSCYIFGSAISSIATSFRQWRIRDLSITYSPLVPTSTTGAVSLAVIQDATLETSGGGIYTTPSCNGAITGPVHAFLPVGCEGNYSKEWLWTQDVSNPTADEKRLTQAGTIISSNPVALSASALYGILLISGTIEFRDLAVNMTLESGFRSISEPMTSPIPLTDAIIVGDTTKRKH